MTDHLSPEEFFDFLDQSGSSGPVGRHLLSCPECLNVPDLILLAEVPATSEEETILSRMPGLSADDLPFPLRPGIGPSGNPSVHKFLRRWTGWA